MNAWSAAALVLLAVGFPAALWGAALGSPVHRLAGLCLAGTVTGAVLLVLPMAFARSSYQDLALVLAVLSPAGVLVFTRFVGGPEGGPPAGEEVR
ncbi:monovalent cation/H+ antiporter complex subunit F [Streptomyces sp. NBC_00249]|uniref:monovalent cation/H+ antiporter complex subunit F n=1 Tax=Streptomyces sp. NBC_00249 TaxID=2975690 RepID=UPI002254F52F|nr:monovalent cation/H+ antiporter complex subunit F [Streptomyces sp. NBC_00249]MCX5195435.1 monovalent cation/H+ antiporter complex subunit F [Streptomyces sp. NBC_00249]